MPVPSFTERRRSAPRAAKSRSSSVAPIKNRAMEASEGKQNPSGSWSNPNVPFTESEVDEMTKALRERGVLFWIDNYITLHKIPVRKALDALNVALAKRHKDSNDTALLPVLREALSNIWARNLPPRPRLEKYNDIDAAIALLQSSKRILVLTGAGISVSCGIPDFRSSNGIYAQLQDKYDLDDPQQMFDIDYFKKNPQTFYSFISQVFPSEDHVPSPCHHFIKLLQDKGKLTRNYTQNIDCLEGKAGIQNVLHCHGSFEKSTCMDCGTEYPSTVVATALKNDKLPVCPLCEKSLSKSPSKSPRKPKSKSKRGRRKDEWEDDDDTDGEPPPPSYVLKPNITFFGEAVNSNYLECLLRDREIVDLVLVIGTSMKVSPVSEFLAHIPPEVPQILINKTPVTRKANPDIILLGNADAIVQNLCRDLQWALPTSSSPRSTLGVPLLPAISRKRSGDHLSEDVDEPRRVAKSHVWLFEGAEVENWDWLPEATGGLELNSRPGADMSRPSTPAKKSRR